MSYIQILSSLVDAVIYQPANVVPKGGIVLLHGSEGGSAKWIGVIAVLLAANGFTTMPKPYNQADALLTRPDIKNIPLEGTEKALLHMRKLMNTHKRKYRFIGSFQGSRAGIINISATCRRK
ncbi:MAG: hypothetical protein AAF652_05470 [Cyanobacteria bacterium P01_C01_bin.72]